MIYYIGKKFNWNILLSVIIGLKSFIEFKKINFNFLLEDNILYIKIFFFKINFDEIENYMGIGDWAQSPF